MGYRSDVKYVICLPDDKAYAGYMAEVNLMLADKPDMKDILDKLKESEDIEVVETGFAPTYKYRFFMQWDYVKWYDDYDWVKIQHEIMELAEQYDGAWFFARIGENDDDIETKEACEKGLYWHDYIQLNRSLSFI